MSKGIDGCFIDSGDKQAGGSTGTETVGFDAGWGDVGNVFNIGSSDSEFLGDDDEHPSLHVMQGTVSCRSLLDTGTTEGHILQSEGLAPAPLGGRGESILTWVAQEEESDGT